MTEPLSVLTGLVAVQGSIMEAIHVGLQIMVWGLLYALYVPSLPRLTR